MATTRYTVIDGEILSENRNGTKRDYVPDPLGSTLALLDSTQTQTDTFSYYPYGEVASRTGTTATPFQYVGTLGYYQDTSGRTYVRARHLRTAHGRWMTQDPIGFDGDDFNLYRYVYTSPVSYRDPSGNKVQIVREGIGNFFDHAYFHFDKPCWIWGNDVAIEQSGFAGAFYIVVGGKRVHKPYLNYQQWIQDTFTGKDIENALCECIKENSLGIYFPIPFVPVSDTCFTWVHGVVRCAKWKVNKWWWLADHARSKLLWPFEFLEWIGDNVGVGVR